MAVNDDIVVKKLHFFCCGATKQQKQKHLKNLNDRERERRDLHLFGGGPHARHHLPYQKKKKNTQILSTQRAEGLMDKIIKQTQPLIPR